MSLTEQHLETQKVMLCRSCCNSTAFELRGYYETVKQIGQRAVARENYPRITCEVRYWSFWQCITCAEPTITYAEKITEQGYKGRDWPPRVFFSEKHFEKVVEERSTRILYPTSAGVPLPSNDMPSEIAKDYIEARAIFEASARSSAALLRLAIQKLCKHLGQSGKNINDDISALVKKGLPQEIQQALDFVRVIGNNAVHPGEIDIRDNPDVALAMFEMVNYIVDVMITRPRIANEFYDKLPQNIRKAIVNRDSR
jgi:hypothetical protein